MTTLSLGSPKKGKILFQLSGSIAAFKACALISKLVQAGYEVQTVASRSALEFIGPSTLEGLTGKPVFSDAFESGRAMDHIQLARWADLTLLCPASANSINRLAHGIADDCIGTLFLAHRFPAEASRYWVIPAMNAAMWSHPATQTSTKTLRQWGIQILEPSAGALACGEQGQGRLLEPEELFDRIQDFFAHSRPESPIESTIESLDDFDELELSPIVPDRRLRVLITSGATREPIDSVRFISNMSTGNTGATLADAFVEAGHDVVYLHGESAVMPRHDVLTESFETFSDLNDSIQRLLADEPFDVVIHAAAVGDYSVQSIDSQTLHSKLDLETDLESVAEPLERAKLPSDRMLTLRLKPSFKIVERLRDYAIGSSPIIVAFKLTDGGNEADQIRSLLQRSKADYVVHNRRTELGTQKHITAIYTGDPEFQLLTQSETKKELAEKLIDLVELKSKLHPSTLTEASLDFIVAKSFTENLETDSKGDL